MKRGRMARKDAFQSTFFQAVAFAAGMGLTTLISAP